MNEGPVEIFNTGNGTTCEALAQIPTGLKRHEALMTYMFDRIVMCGGYKTDRMFDDCWALRSNSDKWEIHPGLKTGRQNAAGASIQYNGRDRYWWISGGKSGLDDMFTASTEIMWKNGDWDDGPDLPQPMRQHCMIQISNCEVAIIGGSRGHSSQMHTISDEINIYNLETRAWRQGPRLLSPRSYHRCIRLKDTDSGHPLIVMACGEDTDNYLLNTVEIWDTVTDDIRPSKHMCPEPYEEPKYFFDIMDTFNDYEGVFANGNKGNSTTTTNKIYAFTLEGGFQHIGAFPTARDESVGILAPPGYVTCK